MTTIIELITSEEKTELETTLTNIASLFQDMYKGGSEVKLEDINKAYHNLRDICQKICSNHPDQRFVALQRYINEADPYLLGFA